MRVKHISYPLIILAGVACAGLLGVWRPPSALPIVMAEPPQPPAAEPAKVAVYDPEPSHLWNRLHSVLYVRTDKSGRVHGEDQLDPILWQASTYLLTNPLHRQARALLDEFLANDGQKLIKDPLKRALFQRDLWAIFDWLVESDRPGFKTYRFSAERRELRIRLAQIIRRLALSAEQIQTLPDNYAATVAAKVFPTKHDPSQPKTAFLPPDLLDPEGAWVVLKRNDTPFYPALITQQHNEFAKGRSVFFIIMNLPQGRKATLAYLKRLREFPNPVKDYRDRSAIDHLNADLPNFPAGTQIALVRQMSVIDDQGKIAPTKLIEMVQLRVFREVPRKEDLSPKSTFQAFNPKDDVYEFRLRRKELLADKSGSLRVMSLETGDIDLFSTAQMEISDFFEHPDNSPERPPAGPLTFARCHGCHGSRGPGIHSVNSYRGYYPPTGFLDSNRRDQQEEAIRWKERDHTWGFLKGLLEGQSKK